MPPDEPRVPSAFRTLTTRYRHDIGDAFQMDLVWTIVDFILHFDDHLQHMIETYGMWTYAFLFLIIFCETGLVVLPFLPGDSLLFAAGAFATRGEQGLNIAVVLGLLSVAGILGDTVNYWAGKWIGPRAFSGTIPMLNKSHLDKTNAFFAKYGGKTIILARFVPIVRTFAPFVAGIGAMNYAQFIVYNVVGGVLWVGVCTMAGYFFGSFEIVQKNFELVIVGIIAVSVLPMAWELFAARRHAKANVEAAAGESPVQP